MSFILQPDRKAAEAAAPRNECALKILLLIPDNSNTDLSHRAKVDVVTSSKVTNEINKLDVFLTSFVRLIYDNNVYTTHNSGFSYRFKTMAGKPTPGLDVFNSF